MTEALHRKQYSLVDIWNDSPIPCGHWIWRGKLLCVVLGRVPLKNRISASVQWVEREKERKRFLEVGPCGYRGWQIQNLENGPSAGGPGELTPQLNLRGSCWGHSLCLRKVSLCFNPASGDWWVPPTLWRVVCFPAKTTDDLTVNHRPFRLRETSRIILEFLSCTMVQPRWYINLPSQSLSQRSSQCL